MSLSKLVRIWARTCCPAWRPSASRKIQSHFQRRIHWRVHSRKRFPRIFLLSFFVLIGFAGLARGQNAPVIPHPQLPGADSLYLSELLEQVRTQRLWEHIIWQRLLHYRKNTLLPGVTSDVDRGAFFLARSGRTNPRAELEHNLAAFFSAQIVEPTILSAQCVFPARFLWLQRTLRIDPTRLPTQPCSKFQAWRKFVNPQSLWLVFSTYYTNNPASAFGHTLFVFSPTARDRPALLDIALNFSALRDDQDGNFIYAWKGLTGGYLGTFTLLPYHLKVREYNAHEQRDLWEYQLNLSPAQVDFIFRHVWELLQAQIEYYFLDENCSWYLLTVLEVADAELDLSSGFPLWALPADTLRRALEAQGVLQQVHHRPSLASRTEWRLEALSAEERTLAFALAKDAPATLESAPYAQLAAPRRTYALDAALALRRLEAEGDRAQFAQKPQQRSLLSARSELGLPTDPPTGEPHSSPPHLGHGSALIGLSGGARQRRAARQAHATGSSSESTTVWEITVQPVLHDLISTDLGYTPFSQMRMLSLSVRAEETPAGDLDWHLQRFSLLDIFSLAPQTFVRSPWSWELLFGWQRVLDAGCVDCTPLLLRGGAGLSWSSFLGGRQAYYILGEGEAALASAFEASRRWSGTLRVGLLTDLGQRWRMGVDLRRGRWRSVSSGDLREDTLSTRLRLSEDAELRLEGRAETEQNTLSLGLYQYF